MRVQVVYWYLVVSHYVSEVFLLTGNVLDAAVCYQKAIEQDPHKLASRVVCDVMIIMQFLHNGCALFQSTWV